MCDTWLSAINKSHLTGAVFLDLRKAFDLVNHDILLQKLNFYLQNSHTVSFLESFLRDRTQRVFINGQYSQVGRVVCGVPQGSILGPLLFCLFINDLPLHISDEDVVCDLFADDNSVHSSSASLEKIQLSLQQSLDDIFSWCNSNRMLLHPKKSKSMIITSRQKHQLQPLTLDLKLGTERVEQVNSHRVLGVTIDHELRWHIHIQNVCKRISQNLYLLSKLNHYVDTDALKSFFHAHCLSHINFASTVWSGASETHLKKLNSLYRRGAKIILSGQPISTDLKMKRLGLLQLKQQFDFNIAVLVFKTQINKAPPYLGEFLLNPPARYASNKYIIPRHRIDMYKSSFAFGGSTVWNSLPPKLKTIKTISTFKSNLKKHFLTI